MRCSMILAVLAVSAIAIFPRTGWAEPRERDPAVPHGAITTDKDGDRESSSAASDATKMKGESGVLNALKSDEIVGEDVRNASNEDLGSVNDLVIDLNTGMVRYVAVSSGGFLGIGDKLFAVPFKSLKYFPETSERDAHFLLNITKDRLLQAPSFSSNDWPSFADPDLTARIDRFYQADQPRTAERPGETQRK